MSDNCLDLTSEELLIIPEYIFDKNETEKLLLDFNSIHVIPPTLCEKLPYLSCLSLNGNMIESLPADIDKLTSLRELYLTENLLCELPDNLVKLKYLQKFHITGNLIKTLPDNISSLENLTELFANENEIGELPEDFGQLQCLSILELGYNSISFLPENFGSLISLKLLSICNNSLAALPSSFKDLSSIEMLDLSYNDLINLPETFSSAEKLTKILLSNNSICCIPDWFSNLSKVTEIDMRGNALQDTPFPDNFGNNSVNLEHLDLRGNHNLTGLPSTFGNLRSLKNLHLGSAGDPQTNRLFSFGNSIAKLPDSFSQLSNLTVLELDENSISKLPMDFGCLSNVVYLNLSHNDLGILPDSFCDLKQLEVCILSINCLTFLPENFGCLSSLKDLMLDENMLIELPESFENLSNLVSLDLYHNKLNKIPPCLQALKSLKILDLKENDFDLPLDEIPDKYIPARYLARKPELKDNWRGKKREEIAENLYVNENEDVEHRDRERDLLSYALRYSISLWRRHGDDGIRKPSYMNNGDSPNSSKHPECWDNDLLDVPQIGDSPNSSKHPECWDNDLLDVPQIDLDKSVSSQANSDFENSESSDSEEDAFENISPFKKVYAQPVKSDIESEFVPSDIHAPLIICGEVWNFVEDGQFDDE